MAYRQPSSIKVETDVTHEEKRRIQERAKLRATLKQEYVRQITDPHKHGQGGLLFDPAVQRFHSAKAGAQIYETFKPTPRGAARWLGVCILPMLAFGYLVKRDREEFERKCRTGEIKYEDRMFKLM
uniref:NADH dehydrogenase [ubiquinone] 1 beta subcomplex subunit 4 n=1 Tax=Ixodes ricinus TaxID=34613 RepID=A0A6B0UPF8_IXORI